MSLTVSLNRLLGKTIPCSCGREHVVPTREVLCGLGASDRVSEVLERHVPGRGGVLVADEVTWQVAGERVHGLLDGWQVRPVILQPAETGALKADERSLRQLADAIDGPADFLLCVGSGTLNDLTKTVATARQVPSVCVATAPSMNGYPSAIAALSRDGIKVTEPCEPPVAIICDTHILRHAPASMIGAGLGDLLSKGTSSTDWLMGHVVLGEYFCEQPVEVVAQAEALCIEHAHAIARRRIKAIDLLSQSLIQSGISMAMAGSSSPASGGEHLISHYWDMVGPAAGLSGDLHGRQVAVAAVLMARLYELLKERTRQGVDLGAILASRPSAESLREESLAHFAPLVAPATAQQIADFAVGKHMPADRLRGALGPLANDPWGFWKHVGTYLRPSAQIVDAYRRGGVPTRAREIGIPGQWLLSALRYARHIRLRYTVLDLAADLNLLDEFIATIDQEEG